MADASADHHQQRRSASRFGGISVNVKLRPLSAGAEALTATICNLSATGALLNVERQIKVGDPYDIEFSMPTKHPFVFKATVVRVGPSVDGRWEAGVRFGFVFNDETALILWLFSKAHTPA